MTAIYTNYLVSRNPRRGTVHLADCVWLEGAFGVRTKQGHGRNAADPANFRAVRSKKRPAGPPCSRCLGKEDK